MKKIIFAALFSAILIFSGSRTNAQSEEVREAHTKVFASFEKLSAINAVQLTPAERLEKEFLVKKEIVINILNLSALETGDLKEKLGLIENLDPDFSVVQDNYLELLENYIGYLKVLEAQAQKASDLEAVHKLAGDFKSWRAGNYDPEIKKVIDFILIFQNRELIKIAELRFEKISAELKKIKLQKLAADHSANLLINSSLELKAARDINKEAADEFLAQILESQKAENSAPLGPLELKPEPEDEKSEIPKPLSVRDLVENSLNKIRAAYQDFVKIADIIISFYAK